MDHVLNYLKKTGQPLTVDAYLKLALLGKMEDLGPEDRAEILDLIEAGELAVPVPGSRCIQ